MKLRNVDCIVHLEFININVCVIAFILRKLYGPCITIFTFFFLNSGVVFYDHIFRSHILKCIFFKDNDDNCLWDKHLYCDPH